MSRLIDRELFEAAAEIVSPGTKVTIRDGLPWRAADDGCVGVSGTPAAVLTFVFGLGRLADPGQAAVADDLIGNIAYRTDGMEIIAVFPLWQFTTDGER
jgi:hypothetical protein